MAYISNESAINYIRTLNKRKKQEWSSLYPKASPLALDLLDKMLAFNPDKRLTVKKCLEHPFFEELHYPDEEFEAMKPFDWSFDDFELDKEKIQLMIYEEACSFHP